MLFLQVRKKTPNLTNQCSPPATSRLWLIQTAEEAVFFAYGTAVTVAGGGGSAWGPCPPPAGSEPRGGTTQGAALVEALAGFPPWQGKPLAKAAEKRCSLRKCFSSRGGYPLTQPDAPQPPQAMPNPTSGSAGAAHQKRHGAEKGAALSLPALPTFQWLLQTNL